MAIWIIAGYLLILLGIGLLSQRRFQGTTGDYFLASRSIGPFLLLMSLFGTTMTAFALVGSTGKAYVFGIGVYGLMASWAAVVHPAMFFLVGVKVWRLGRKHGYVTQVQLFRDRFQSNLLGVLLFPILVLLVIPYLLIGILGAGITVEAVTQGEVTSAMTGAVICGVVLTYVFFGGIRAAAWANAFQTLVFLFVGFIAFWVISDALGGASAATAASRPALLMREGLIDQPHFFSYGLVGLSVGMFPHLFQHWLTARSAKSFRLPVVAHPLLVMLVWLPCVLLGVWASGVFEMGTVPPNAILGALVKRFTSEWMSGVLTAGILAAIMSSLDSQFLCLGTMFTNDIVMRSKKAANWSEAKQLWMARSFVAIIVLVTYLLSLVSTRGIFDLGVWCFTGFSGLVPLIIGALYWRRATAAGAIACVITVAISWSALFLAHIWYPPAKGQEFLIGGMMPVVVIFAASTLALVLVSWFTKPPDEESVERFFPRQQPTDTHG